jgi:hypothetical protein
MCFPAVVRLATLFLIGMMLPPRPLVGGGLAYTPNEDFGTGRLVSFQAGWSFEHYARDRVAAQTDSNSGGDELLLHPTLVYSPGQSLLMFGIVSLPVWRHFEDRASEDVFRFGTGVVYAW